MVGLLLIVGFVGLFIGIGWCKVASDNRDSCLGPALVILLSLGCFVATPFTPQGQLWFKKFTATASGGNWLVIDNSGGETLRHWLLEDIFVESSSQSDGWQFYDDCGNLCYVSGDAFVMRINDDLRDFRENYKGTYNIPKDQEPCECK
jgi:hypothetical protein